MDQQHVRTSFWGTPFGTVATIAAAAASVYLWVAHKDHVGVWLLVRLFTT